MARGNSKVERRTQTNNHPMFYIEHFHGMVICLGTSFNLRIPPSHSLISLIFQNCSLWKIRDISEWLGGILRLNDVPKQITIP
jgi:hypothetical protein